MNRDYIDWLETLPSASALISSRTYRTNHALGAMTDATGSTRRSACTAAGALGENNPSSRANGPRAPLARSFDPLSL